MRKVFAQAPAICYNATLKDEAAAILALGFSLIKNAGFVDLNVIEGAGLAKVLGTGNMSKCIGCFTCMLICAGVNRKDHSIQKSCIKIRTYGGLAGKFVETVCHACIEPSCAEACPSNALKLREGGGVLLNALQCIACRRCQAACTVRAIDFDEDLKQPIICHHCGACARYCPHGCLSIEERQVVD